MINLPEYLGHVVARRSSFGSDCCTLMADWLVLLGLPDPMSDRRGTYATALEYETMLESEGGMLRSCRRRFAALGLRRTRSPTVGDVCLVKAPTLAGPRVTGAIVSSSRLRVVVARDVGLAFAPLPVLCAWSVPRA